MPLGLNGINSVGKAGGVTGGKAEDVAGKFQPNKGRAYQKASQDFAKIQADARDHTRMREINFKNAVDDGKLIGDTVGGQHAFANLQDLNSALDKTLSPDNLATLELTIQRNKYQDVPCKLSGIDSPTTTKGWVELIKESYSPS